MEAFGPDDVAARVASARVASVAQLRALADRLERLELPAAAALMVEIAPALVVAAHQAGATSSSTS